MRAARFRSYILEMAVTPWRERNASDFRNHLNLNRA